MNISKFRETLTKYNTYTSEDIHYVKAPNNFALCAILQGIKRLNLNWHPITSGTSHVTFIGIGLDDTYYRINVSSLDLEMSNGGFVNF